MTTFFKAGRHTDLIIAIVCIDLRLLSPSPDKVDTTFFRIMGECELGIWL
jgi:hypothetical protein